MFTSKALIIEGSNQLTEFKVWRTSVPVFVSVRPAARWRPALSLRFSAPLPAVPRHQPILLSAVVARRAVAPSHESILAFLRLVPIKY